MKFQPPTREEAETYARSIGYFTFNYDIFYAYYEVRNWCPKNCTKQMSSWQAAIRTFFYRTDEYSAKKRKEEVKKRQAKRLDRERKKIEADKNYTPVSAEQKKQIREMRPEFRKVEKVIITEAEREQRRQKAIKDLGKADR